MAVTGNHLTKDQAAPIREIRFESWTEFQEYVNDDLLNDCGYVYRGHRCDNWLLESTLTRVFKSQPHLNVLSGEERKKRVEQHFYEFQYAIRGRRGVHPPKVEGGYLWALGQHFGLATPLLDWTTSPFLAAFFAFGTDGTPQSDYRTIFAAKMETIQVRYSSGEERINFFSPLSDENPRLVNQGGLFSRLPVGADLESWTNKHFTSGTSTPILLKLLVPNGQRDVCIRSLSRMNINHLSAFPDLQGASLFCNLALANEGYALHLGRPQPQRIRTVSMGR